MAKIQMQVEELLQLAHGSLPTQEMKENLAKAILDVWNSEFLQSEINRRAEELAKKKMERIIQSAFTEEKQWSYGETKTVLSGWGASLVKEYMSKTTVDMLVAHFKDTMKDQVHSIVQESLTGILTSSLISNLARNGKNGENNENKAL